MAFICCLFLMCSYWTWSPFCFLDIVNITYSNLEVLWWIAGIILVSITLFSKPGKWLLKLIWKLLWERIISRLVWYVRKIVQKIPYRVVNIKKKRIWNAYLYTNFNWLFRTYIIVPDWNEIHITLWINEQEEFPTEESLMDYVTFWKVNKIVQNLWESKTNTWLSKAYRIID